jgi:predicted transcriptional regulator
MFWSYQNGVCAPYGSLKQGYPVALRLVRSRGGGGTRGALETLQCSTRARPLDLNYQPLEPLSPSEWDVLACVYDLRSANPFQVSKQLRLRNLRSFAPSTCGVLLGRVAQKGYLTVTTERQARGRPLHIYTPTVPWQMALRRQFEKFLEAYRVDGERLETLASILEARTTAKC